VHESRCRDRRVRRRDRDRAPARPSLYDPFVDRPEPLVRAHAPVRVSGRLDGRGREISTFDGSRPDDPRLVDAIASCLLHADLELAATSSGCAICSARKPSPRRLLARSQPEFREYERMVTTVVEAFLEPVCAPYLIACRDAREPKPSS
jgi:N-methylhydantoinase A